MDVLSTELINDPDAILLEAHKLYFGRVNQSYKYYAEQNHSLYSLMPKKKF
jgi:hypothetical protein